MPPLRIVLLVLAIPAALAGYTIATQLLSLLPLAAGLRGLVLMFVPLLVGGLCALPLLIPFVDAKAKEALANRPVEPVVPRKGRRRDREA